MKVTYISGSHSVKPGMPASAIPPGGLLSGHPSGGSPTIPEKRAQGADAQSLSRMQRLFGFLSSQMAYLSGGSRAGRNFLDLCILFEKIHHLGVHDLVIDFDQAIALLKVLEELFRRDLIHACQRLNALEDFLL